MEKFGHGQNINIEKLCREFYDFQVFEPPVISGIDAKSFVWNTYFNSVVEADASFAKVGSDTFLAEIHAIQLEMFALAFGEKFKNDDMAMRQSAFTKDYLRERDALNMWETMGEYNRALAQSATMNHKFEQVGNIQVARLNEKRFVAVKKWAESEIDKKCIGRVINRIGVDVHRADAVASKRLAVKLAERLNCDPKLKPEALFRLEAIIFGLYRGAEDYLKSSHS